MDAECLTLFITGAIIGLLPAAIAYNKGRSFLLWWVLGASFFIIALPLSIVIQKNEEALESRRLANGKAKKCPRCAEIIKKEAVVCRYCGFNYHEN